MSLHNDLRATSDELLRDLEALGALEEDKRSLPLDDPRLVEIAERIEVIAGRVLAGSTRQTSLAVEASETAASVASPPSIEDVSRPLSAILADWREVERRAADAPEGSAEAAEIEVLATRLRQEYRLAYGKRSTAD